MVVVLRPIWHKVGDAFPGKKGHFEVAWILCWKEEEASFERNL